MKHLATALALVLLTVISSPVYAKNEGKLPKGAVALTPAETQALFAGKSIDYKVSKYSFAPDGSVKGVDPKGHFAEGAWHVSGNEFCLDVNWHGDDKAAKPFPYSQCNKFFSYKKVIWSQNTKGEDEYLGDINNDTTKKIRSGDIASAAADALKKKYGY